MEEKTEFLPNETQQRLTRRGAIFWLGGAQFGGCLYAAKFVADAFAGRPFDWRWSLVAQPLLFYGAGCFVGLLVWKYFGERRRAPVPRAGTGEGR